METNDEIQFRYSLPKGVFWWLVWVMALLSNLFAVVLPIMMLLYSLFDFFTSPSVHRRSFSMDWRQLLFLSVILSLLLLIVVSAASVLGMMNADKAEAVYKRRKVGIIANALLAVITIALAVVSAVVSGTWPVWPVLMMGGLYSGLNFFVMATSRRRVRKGVCLSCGYNLTGNTTGTCPECGHVIEKTSAESG